MKRTQIYLPEDLHEAVRRLAFEQRRSMADVVREAVTAYVAEETSSPSTESAQSFGASDGNRDRQAS